MFEKKCFQCNIRIPIVTTHFADAVYDVSRWKCSNSKYKTILDCLAIDNHNITNYLVRLRLKLTFS